ncbi:MAG: zf-HC2 domain-containing protein [Anaerolineae bacterium]|nr:zf-HC2 domain-containing protein [Anaerolineae bacterium]MDW8098474.1 zf-HC2 domain-containing protein [Anaerolineae bacterium]
MPQEHLSEVMIAAAVEGHLAPWERHRVVRHLAACSRCAAEWAALHTLLQQTRQIAPVPLGHPLEEALGWLSRLAPLPPWAWHAILFALTPLLWLVLVESAMVFHLGILPYTLRAWPAAWLMTTHFLWLQPRLREMIRELWEAGVSVEEVEAFQRRYLAMLQGQGWGSGWLFLGLALGGTVVNWVLVPPDRVWEGVKTAVIGFYALLATAAMYWGWLWGGRLWWGLAQLAQQHSPLKERSVLARARRLAGGWVVVAGASMLWHLVLSFGAPEIRPAVQIWGGLISLVLLSLWGGYAVLEWRLAQRPILQWANWRLVARLALTLALVALTSPLAGRG